MKARGNYIFSEISINDCGKFFENELKIDSNQYLFTDLKRKYLLIRLTIGLH